MIVKLAKKANPESCINITRWVVVHRLWCMCRKIMNKDGDLKEKEGEKQKFWQIELALGTRKEKSAMATKWIIISYLARFILT